MKIYYFGDEYSHTYAAARDMFADADDSAFVGCDSIFDIFAEIRSGGADYGVVPIENSVEGTVAATIDALGEKQVCIDSEYILPIGQSLIAKNGVGLNEIKRIYSHPQALAQCRNNIRKILPDAELEAVAYTSAGLNKLGADTAAIARVPKEGQTVIVPHIEDSPENCTRFIAVTKFSEACLKKKGDKMSVMFSTRNTPGALLLVLEELKARNLNMTKIESRPAKKKMGQYVFYVDFMYGGNDIVGLCFTLAARAAGEIRFLGRYKKYKAASRKKETEQTAE